MTDVSQYAAHFKVQPFKHQLVGIDRLVHNTNFGLFDEMGAGKSCQVVNAACILHEEDKIDGVMIVSPASVRGVWLDPGMGEIQKHCWRKWMALEYHAKGLRLVAEGADNANEGDPLAFIVTNYEFIRAKERRDELIKLIKDQKILLVLDESSFIKSRNAKQTKACLELAKHATRRVILNGTPITNSPMDLWSQLRFLSPDALPFTNFFAFRSSYAVMGGWQGKQVVQYVNLDDLQKRVAPFVIRREKKDCLDLPPKTYTQLEVPLTEESWRRYKEMRDECITFIDENPSLAAQAGVKVMRLAQITSGILGGFDVEGTGLDERESHTMNVGFEKENLFIEWLQEKMFEYPNSLKVIAWCRFRRQLDRLHARLGEYVRAYKLQGGQPKAEREEAVNTFSRAGTGSAVLCAQQQAGSFGLNLVAANLVVYLSNDFSLATRIQSEDRCHRPGQTKNVYYLDILCTGPRGQRTVDHAVLRALRKKDELARWTASAWKEALIE